MGFRRRSSGQGDALLIDDELWALVVAPVLAARDGDAKAHRAAHLRWTDLPIPRQRRAELCCRFLLGLKLSACLPDRDDMALRDLSLRLAPRVSDLVRGTPETYQAVLRTALGEPKAGDDIGAVAVDMSATALLGALLGSEPTDELAEMRPRLEAWYESRWDDLQRREQSTNG